jgi:hypothetical protein
MTQSGHWGVDRPRARSATGRGARSVVGPSTPDQRPALRKKKAPEVVRRPFEFPSPCLADRFWFKLHELDAQIGPALWQFQGTFDSAGQKCVG